MFVHFSQPSVYYHRICNSLQRAKGSTWMVGIGCKLAPANVIYYVPIFLRRNKLRLYLSKTQ